MTTYHCRRSTLGIGILPAIAHGSLILGCLVPGLEVHAGPIQDANPPSPLMGEGPALSTDRPPQRLNSLIEQATDSHRRDGLIIIPFKSGSVRGAIAFNPSASASSNARLAGAPPLPMLNQIYGVGFGDGVFSGDPPSVLDWPLSMGIFDTHPFGLFAKNFDVLQLPSRTSWDYGLGDVPATGDFGPMFNSYFAEFPQTMAAVAWATDLVGGDPDPPLLSATTTPTNALPRTLHPFNTYGDYEPFSLQVIGTPDLGDGVIGWEFVGDICRDCNLNFIDDAQDIVADPSIDLDGNGIPDECEVAACNVDFGDFFGAPLPEFGGAKGQPGAWFPFGPVFPENQPLPLLNVGDTMSGMGIEWNFNGNAVFSDGAIVPGMGPEFFPLMADGWNLGNASGATDLLMTGVPNGQYAVDVYAFNPTASGFGSTNVTVPFQSPQKITGPWPGGFQLGETHACFTVDVTDGTIPIAMQGIGGNGFLNGIQLRPLFDCNLNGVDDATEILGGTVSDWNLNGIPDVCESELTIRQCTWVAPDGIVSAPLTDIGQITVEVPQPPVDQPCFFNAVINDQWVVQNGILVNLNNDPTMSYTFPCQLGVTPGVAAGIVQCEYTLTCDPLVAAPEAVIPAPVLVEEKLFQPGTESDPADSPDGHIPGPGQNFIGTIAVPDPFVRRNVPHVSELKNHCVPGGIARSMSWLNDLYCLGFPPDCSNPQGLLNTLATNYFSTTQAAGTAVPNQMNGTTQFLVDKGLDKALSVKQINPVNGDTPTPDDIVDGLKKGKDVMFVVIWLKADGTNNGAHFMTVTGAVEGDSATDHQFTLQDDAMGANSQGDGMADTGSFNFQFGLRGDGTYQMNGVGVGSNRLKRIVYICPRPLTYLNAISKYVQVNIESVLANAQQSGTVPSAPELNALVHDACNAAVLAGYLRSDIIDSELLNDAETFGAISALRDATADLKICAEQLLANPTLTKVQDMLDLIDDPITPNICVLDGKLDCNQNYIDDSWEIDNGQLTDADNNGLADECEGPLAAIDGCFPCPADIEGVSPGTVDVQDLLTVLAAWGSCPAPCPPTCNADVNEDCVVNVQDLLLVLSSWGPCN